MKLLDSLKVLILFLGIVKICPAQFETQLPCVLAALGGFLLVQNQLDDLEQDCNQKLADQRRNTCIYLVADANIDNCIDCFGRTTAASCALGTDCQFQDGFCGPVAGNVDL